MMLNGQEVPLSDLPIMSVDQLREITGNAGWSRRLTMIRQIRNVLENGESYWPILEMYPQEELERIWNEKVGKPAE